MIRPIRLLLGRGAAGARARAADAQLKVVTSTTDLYDIARGGRRRQDHGVAHRRRVSGPALHRGKAELRSAASQRRRLGVRRPRSRDRLDAAAAGRRAQSEDRQGGSGYVDASKAIRVLDTPQGNVDRSMGDVHPLGNPHYWLDPENGRRIARLFKAKFSELDPKNAATYDANTRAFEAKLNAAETAWAADLATIRGKPIVAWHTSWRYLPTTTGEHRRLHGAEARRTTIAVAPVSGDPDGEAHGCQGHHHGAVLRSEGVRPRREATGIKVLILPPSVGGCAVLR
jgi:hypothetical protein